MERGLIKKAESNGLRVREERLASEKRGHFSSKHSVCDSESETQSLKRRKSLTLF